VGKLLARVVLVLVLAACAPGCATLLTAALTGGNADAVRAAAELDTAVFDAIASGAAAGIASSGGDDDDEDAQHYADTDVWLCRVGGGELQEINAHSVEGARAACIMSNDVDLVPDGCDCIPR
jgi:hypothetical protein